MLTYNLKKESAHLLPQLKAILGMDSMDQKTIENVHGNLLQILDDASRGNYKMSILGVCGCDYLEPTLAKLKDLIDQL